MPRLFISQLRLNAVVRKQTFLVRECSLVPIRTGSLLLRVLLADRSGVISGVQFDAPSTLPPDLVPGAVVEVAGRITEFKDELQITIERIQPIELSDLTELLPVARRPLAEMRAEFDALRASIQNPHLAGLLQALFDDAELYRAFTHAPAAKVYHHACLGGLLEHTLSVARLVEAACGLYPELNRDLVVTGALLHDLGKIRAYDARTFEMTDAGALWTHLYMGASQVEHAIAALPDFDRELGLRLVHAILAHHGKLEHGSPTVPMTLEAIVLHAADQMDGDARGALEVLERAENDPGSLTRLSPMHDTRLYRGPAAQRSSAAPGTA